MTWSKSVKYVLSIAVVGFLALGLASTPAFATTQNTTFVVSATVQGSCGITATALSFGAYTGTALPATSTITVTCTGGTTYNVSLDPGTYSGATVTTRKMTGQYLSGALGYGLFQNAGHSINWGQTIGTDTETGTGTGLGQPLTVYGQIPAGSPPAADGYFDTITATVTY